MTDLVAWLRAALDEHERVAREATTGLGDAYHVIRDGYLGRELRDHIAANDPAHVLRTVQAHREIVDAHPLTVYTDEEPGYVQVLNDHLCPGGQTPCLTVRALATIYRDTQPGFDPTWICDH